MTISSCSEREIERESSDEEGVEDDDDDSSSKSLVKTNFKHFF